MTINEFIENLKELGININEEQLKMLNTYYEMLVKYNENVNLTAITLKEDVYLKHFYDSLTLIKAISLNQKLSICDVGTGAGFPGLVLKIIFPTLSVTLVDALNKRINFLNDVIKTLKLNDIEAIHSRIEDLKFYEKYDVVVSRAVAKTSILLEISCNLPKVNGYIVLMKGQADEELKESLNAIKILSYNLEKVIKFHLPKENSERSLIVLKHIGHTNKKYPRSYAKIKLKNL